MLATGVWRLVELKTENRGQKLESLEPSKAFLES